MLPVSESISPVRRLPINKLSNKTPTLYMYTGNNGAELNLIFLN